MARAGAATARPPQPAGEPQRIGLLWSLLISVLLHAILLTIAMWLPVLRPIAAREIPEETVLRFDFAPVADTSDEASLDGAVPIEPLPDVPPPLPEAPRPSAPARSANVLESLPAGASAAEADPELESSREPSTERAAAAALPKDEAGRFIDREEDPARPRTTRPSAERSFDLNRAIQNFGELLDRAREQRAEATPSQQQSHVYVPDLSSVPSAGYGMGNLVFETRDFDWSDYARQIYVAIWKAWHNRLYYSTDEFEKWARSNSWELQHQNQIRFVIERSGQVSEILIEGPSGCVPLDDSATDALAEVLLPPLPEAFPKEREVVHARFIALGDIRQMRRSLNWLKQRGFF